jgi:hypothetical protein
VSAKYAATHVRFTRIPADARQVDWHTVPERVLTVRLDGSAEYQTSDGDERHVPAGGFILFEDTHGKGRKSRHSPQEQTVIWISLSHGLDQPRPELRRVRHWHLGSEAKKAEFRVAFGAIRASRDGLRRPPLTLSDRSASYFAVLHNCVLIA